MPGLVRYLHQFFEQQVDIRPEAIALAGMNYSFTYSEMEKYTNQIAHYLMQNDIKSGDMVGLFFNRSELPILAMLGILKAGAGYVPIDPSYPEDRIEHIIADASIKLILSETDLQDQMVRNFKGTTVLLDRIESSVKLLPTGRINPDIIGLKDEYLSYIIYTSGSTGKPKGVMCEHRNIVNFVNAFRKVCNMSPDDRVYQGFSFSFDGSVEEIWMAYANGSVLVTGNNDLSKFASETAQYLTNQKITYFSTVPTFLSMIKEDLPTVKTLVVSGEACPQELVDKWALDHRRMLNVYGPTECTVNTTAAECKSGKPVTIGYPLDCYDTFILDDKLEPVKEGEQGELYIGGPTLSRGYMNLSEMTAKAFIPKPIHIKSSSDKIYKTGDLVSLSPDKELIFYGRIDSQVKIRGYRIELSEIEAVLREHPSIHASAVKPFKTNEMTELAAFVVLTKGITELKRDEVIDILKKKLPVYMIPSHLDIIKEMPTLTSGKTDRKKLPEPKTALVKINRIIVVPKTETEKEIAKIWNDIFKLPSISTDDDFFMDLGGYSLIAAQVVSELRKKKSTDIAIRDIYQHSTIKNLSAYLDEKCLSANINKGKKTEEQNTETSSQVMKKVPLLTKYTCIGLQALSIILFSGLTSGLIYLSIILYKLISKGMIPMDWLAAISAVLFLLAYPSSLLLGIISKWLIIGKFKPGKYPIYSMYYFRWWLFTRIQRMTGAQFIAGTPLINKYMRLMGSKIGRNCIINTATFSIFDLIKIGDNSSICFETQLPGYKVENGYLTIGTIEIGKNCYIGIQSSVGINAVLGDDVALDDQSMIPDGSIVEKGEHLRGSPAQKATVRLVDISDKKVNSGHSLFSTAGSIFSVYFVELFIIAAAMPSAGVFYLAFLKDDWLWWMIMIILAIPLFEVSYWVLLILVKHILIGKIRPGIVPVNSFSYLKKWTIDSLISMSRLLTLPLYTTLYILPFMRLLGVKVGKRAELSVISYFSPDLTDIGPESFFADGSIIGGLKYYKGYCEIAANKVGRRSFIGNSAVLPTGKSVGDNCLIGVLSSPPENRDFTPDGTEWLGSPSFLLPHRKKVEGFKDNVIFKPSAGLVTLRLIIDGLRIAIPSLLEIAGIVSIVYLTYYASNTLWGWKLALALPAIGLGIMIATIISVVLVKNVLIGVYKPVIKPLWSPYVWLNEAVNGVYESVAAPILTPLLGTPFFAFFMRLLGVKIGKNVFFETTLFGEFDLVEIDDHAALNVDVIVQNHLFEDRIFKSSNLKIGKDCTLGNMAVILYDTVMHDGSSISSHSLLMKGETIPASTHWEGIPIRRK